MAILRANNLGKSFGERTLFSGVTFELPENGRMGFVGVNGSGKTTLFRMLQGKEEIDEGTLSLSRDCRMSSLDQALDASSDERLYDTALSAFSHLLEQEKLLASLERQLASGAGDALRLSGRLAETQEKYEAEGGLTFRSRTRAALLGLGFPEDALEKPLRLFSGGEIRKALLARILLSPANLLLLDEPTNHLDIAAVEWLEDFLLSYGGAFIVISHDRYFLDRVTDLTLELKNGTTTCTRGNYSTHVSRMLDAREAALRQYSRTQREIKRIEGIIEQQRRWNQARNYVTIASKEKQIARLKNTLVAPEPLPEALRFRFRACEGSGNDVLLTKALSKRYGNKTLFAQLTMRIGRNERVCLIGGNGCGKTTLLKILNDQLEPDEGSFVIGANVQKGYYAQDLGSMCPEKTVLDDLWDSFPRLDVQTLRNTLGLFLFHGDDIYKRVGELSGGEKARVQLLKLMLSGSNFLMLDEPTNHLDIASCEALENALCEYGGTMLIVTHDRYLINKVADRILILGPEGVTEFSGDWDAYKSVLAEQQAAAQEPSPAPGAKNEYQRNKERRAELSRLKNQARRAEQAVSQAEDELARLETDAAEPGISADYAASAELYARIGRQKQMLEAYMAVWEAAEEALSRCQTEMEE